MREEVFDISVQYEFWIQMIASLRRINKLD